jgi:hypothetical protein
MLGAGPSEDDHPEVLVVEEPTKDVAALPRSVLWIRHVDLKQDQELPWAVVADQVEDGTSHLLRHSRLNLNGDVANHCVDSGWESRAVVHLHIPPKIEGTDGFAVHFLPLYVMASHGPIISGRRDRGWSSSRGRRPSGCTKLWADRKWDAGPLLDWFEDNPVAQRRVTLPVVLPGSPV